MIRFVVYGRPQPQGSKRHVGNGRMVESSKNLKPWRQQVTDTAWVECGCMPYAGTGQEAVKVGVRFSFLRPRSAKKRVHPTVKPDIDKCLRAILDSLTGICYRDDAQVVKVEMAKHYGPIEQVEIEVSEL